MSLIGTHTLNPTHDPAELAIREACAQLGHPPVTYNPWHDATWCACGVEVVAGDHGVTPPPPSAEVLEQRRLAAEEHGRRVAAGMPGGRLARAAVETAKTLGVLALCLLGTAGTVVLEATSR